MSLRVFAGVFQPLVLPRGHAAARSMSRACHGGPLPIASGSRLRPLQFDLTARRPASMASVACPVRRMHTTSVPQLKSRSSASPFTLQFFSRAFSTSRSSLIRQTYFPRGGSGGGYGGSGGRPGRPWWRQIKDRIDDLPTMTVIYGLIGVNVGVFLLWQYAISSFQRFRDPALYYAMTRNFVLNEANMMAGRVWTLVTSCFSHSSGSHILMNCIGLYFIAPAAASLVGSASFLALYLGGGVFASLTSLVYHRMRGDRWAGSEGASGAIYATLAFYGALFPNTTFLLFFVVPMPAWAFIGGIFAWDLFSAFGRPNSGVDSAGHVGGIIAGVAAAAMVRRGRMPGFGRRMW